MVSLNAEISYHGSAVWRVGSLIEAVKKFHSGKIFSSHFSILGNSGSLKPEKQAQALSMFGEKGANKLSVFVVLQSV
jgi:hypothetical protein